VLGSHLHHDDLLSYAAMNDNDYVAVPEPLINPAIEGAMLVVCKAGDLILWDSRTIHCNTPACTSPPAAGSVPELVRAVGYVCMTPRRWASCSTLRARRRAFAAGVGSTHWPHDFKPTAPSSFLDLISEAQVAQALSNVECDQRVRDLVG